MSWWLVVWALARAHADTGTFDFVAAPRHADDEVREDVPTLVHVAMDGVTLDRCPDGDISAAKRCTSLVPGPTVFPAWGTATERAATMQALRSLYADLDIVLVDEPPLPFVPHMLAVVGGTSSLIGQPTTSCGLATLVCGGHRRDLVSLSFAHSCGGWESPTRVASTVAQETAHNLGLEHVNVADDVMFPTVSQVDQTFRDACLDILTPNYDDAYVCPDVHAIDCPDGGGAQQNAHGELLRLLGPADPEASPPHIVGVEPDDGATFEAGASVRVSAMVDHDNDAIGVRWTWLLGPPSPDGYGPTTTRCTNGMCELGYARDKAVDTPWDFIELEAASPGTYAFQLEVADVRGHLETRTITFDVESESTGSDTSGADVGAGADGDAGCGCRGRATDAPWVSMLLAVALMRRHRQRGLPIDHESAV